MSGLNPAENSRVQAKIYKNDIYFDSQLFDEVGNYDHSRFTLYFEPDKDYNYYFEIVFIDEYHPNGITLYQHTISSSEEPMPDPDNQPNPIIPPSPNSIFVFIISLLIPFVIYAALGYIGFRKQPKRKYIYYIGGTHHYFVLKQTLEKARKPFKLVYEIPEGGVKGYASSAKRFKEVVMDLENNKIKPELKPVSLEKFLNSRGRYTNRKYWEYIKVIKKINSGKKNPIFRSERMPIAEKNQYFEGFSKLYTLDAIKEMKVPA